MREPFRFAAILGLFGALALFSCENNSSDNTALLIALSQSQKSQSSNQAAPAKPAVTIGKDGKKYITFNGSAGDGVGAVPASVAKGIEEAFGSSPGMTGADNGAEGVSKSALPGLDTTSAGAAYQWFARATSGSDTVDGEFGTTTATRRVFSMNLEVGKSWTVVCGIKVKDSEPPAVILSDSYEFEATEDNAVFSHTFTPVPQEGGSGSVSLQIAVDSSVGRATAVCSADAWKDANGGNEEKVLELDGASATLEIAGLASGSYDALLNFYTNVGTASSPSWLLLYSSQQQITVFANASTDTWRANGGSGKISGNKLVVDTDEIRQYAPSIIYVGDTRSTVSDAKAPSDSNSGSATDPLLTMAAAVNMIEAAASAASKKGYTIFVCGTVTSQSSADNAIFSDALDGKSSGIAICGLGTGDCLDANSKPGSVITVNTKVPLAIKNLKVTGGNSASEGGGIYADANASITLASGADVSGNKAKFHGGGIYLESGAKLVIKQGAEISQNRVTDNAEGSGGGAVYANGAKVVMQGGAISQNVCGSNALGAVRLENASSLEMKGGLISQNQSGAVYVSADSNFSVQGSASVPYDSANKQNDVCLAKKTDGSYQPVLVSGAFSPDVSAGKIAISAEGWNRKKTVVQATANSGVGDLTGICNNFFELALDDMSFSVKKQAAALVSPYYVSNTGNDGEGVLGTKTSPYRTISHAVSKISGGDDETICVNGELTPVNLTGNDGKSPEVIPESFTTAKCKELTIKGATPLAASGIPSDAINRNLRGNSDYTGGLRGDGCALAIESDVPIKIENLKITGGLSVHGGGGIRISKSGAKVSLGDGTLVTGNATSATEEAGTQGGGGVYVGDGASLFISGAAQIGDKDVDMPAFATAGANYSSRRGGGIYNRGSVYIGYSGVDSSGNLVKKDVASGFGIFANYAQGGGGGICNEGTLKINSGSFAKNCGLSDGGAIAVYSGTLDFDGGKIFANRSYGDGAAIYLAGGNAVMTGGTIGGSSDADANEAYSNACGGAVYVNPGNSFKMTGGTISYNKAKSGGGVYVKCSEETPVTYGIFEMAGGTVSNNTATSGEGGAVYNMGAFKLSKSPSIPYGVGSGSAAKAPGKNDVFLYTNKDDGGSDSDGGYRRVTLSEGAFTEGAPDTVAQITLGAGNWKRGRNVLYASAYGGATGAQIVSLCASRFAMTDDAFEVMQRAEDSSYGMIDAPVYIAGTGKSSDITGSPSDSASSVGSKKLPFASVKYALEHACDDSDFDYTIRISGAIDGGSEIPASGFSAKSLKIEGYSGFAAGANGLMNDKLNGVKTSGSEKPALTVNSTVPVTIEKLGLFNGGGTIISDEPCGGGLYIPAAGAHVTLSEDAYVALNKFKNTSTNASLGRGGGVYIAAGASLYMCKSAYVGTKYTTNSTLYNSYKNFAKKGAGIYNEGNLYLGYKYKDGAMSEETLTGGVRGNGDTGDGGGIYTVGKFLMKSGNVTLNGGWHGAGIYSEAAALNDAKIEGGTLDNNEATYEGGGVYVLADKYFYVTGGTIKNNKTKYQDEYRFGGAVYCDGTLGLGGDAYFQDGTVAQYKNDLALSGAGKISVESGLEKDGVIATLSMVTWSRGVDIIFPGTSLGSGITDEIAQKFVTVDEDFTVEMNGSGATATGILDAPYYVASADNGGDDTDGDGSKKKPFLTVNKAAKATWSGPATINIIGTLEAPQSIPSSGVSAASIKLAGTSADSAIDAKSGNSALIVESSVEVTISNLTITGGKGGENSLGYSCGGGIWLKSSGVVVTLDDGAKVSGNICKYYGGGVYVENGATLNIKKGAEICENGTESPKNVSGAGVYNKGVVNMTGGSIHDNVTTGGYGGGIYNTSSGKVFVHGGDPKIYSNTALSGGGIYNYGTIKFGVDSSGNDSEIKSDELDYATMYDNKALATANSYGGGAIYNSGSGPSSKAAFIMKSGIIGKSGSPNTSYCGGGIYNSNYSTFEMSGGKIYYNNATGRGGGVYCYSFSSIALSSNVTISNNTAAQYGGAIYYDGDSFAMGGLMNIPYGVNGTEGAGKNDVCLGNLNSDPIQVTNAITVGVSGKKIGVGAVNLKRGFDFAKGTLSFHKNKFVSVYADWSVEPSGTGASATEKFQSPYIYVSGPGHAEDVSDGSDSAQRGGSRNVPLSSVPRAAEICNDPNVDYIIRVSGQALSSVSEKYKIPSTVTAEKAKSITIEGYGSGENVIYHDRTYNGPALMIESPVPITIQNVKIANGYRTGSASGSKYCGGGLSLASGANVTIASGTVITGNHAKNGGGGVWNGGNLTIIGGEISGNDIGEEGVADAVGVAIYNTGTLKIKDAPKIDGDVYSTSGKYISVDGAVTSSSSISVTPCEYTHGTTVLAKTENCGDADFKTAASSKFALEDDTWEINMYGKIQKKLASLTEDDIKAIESSMTDGTIVSDISAIVDKQVYYKTNDGKYGVLCFTNCDASGFSFSYMNVEDHSVKYKGPFTSATNINFDGVASATSSNKDCTVEVSGSTYSLKAENGAKFYVLP